MTARAIRHGLHSGIDLKPSNQSIISCLAFCLLRVEA